MDDPAQDLIRYKADYQYAFTDLNARTAFSLTAQEIKNQGKILSSCELMGAKMKLQHLYHTETWFAGSQPTH